MFRDWSRDLLEAVTHSTCILSASKSFQSQIRVTKLMLQFLYFIPPRTELGER
jgi:hypothetical protein